MSDLISRHAVMNRIENEYRKWGDEYDVPQILGDIEDLPFAEPGWIPFKVRDLTDEEQKEHPEWEFIVDCKLPENGQRILVSIDIAGHERVQFDEFYDDDGVYLDSGYEIGEEAVAWMPLPNPYQEGDK